MGRRRRGRPARRRGGEEAEADDRGARPAAGAGGGGGARRAAPHPAAAARQAAPALSDAGPAAVRLRWGPRRAPRAQRYWQDDGFATQNGFASNSVMVIGNNVPGLVKASDPACQRSAGTLNR